MNPAFVFTLQQARRRGRAGLLLLLLLAGLLLGAAATAHAGEALRLSVTTPDVDAWPAVTMLADPAGTLDAAGALIRGAEFAPPRTPHANLGVQRGVVWLRLAVEMPERDDSRWVLEIDYPSLDRVDVFQVSDGLVVRQTVLGDEVPFAQRRMATRAHALPLDFERGLEHELLLRVQTTSSMIVPLRLVKLEAFHEHESREQLVQGLLTGIGLCLLLYALAHWAGGRDPIYLYYAVSSFGTTLFFFAYYGLAPQYLWPDSPWPTQNMAPLAVLVGLGGGMLLIERMLDVRALSLRAAQAATAVAAVAFGVAALFGFSIVGYRFAHLVGTVLGPLPMLLAVPTAWVRWRQGDRAAAYIFGGWAVYAVAVAVMVGLLRGWVDSNGWTQHAFQAGSTIEMLVWLRVLGMRSDAAHHRAERETRERELMQALAHTDALTGLPNRRRLEHELRGALAPVETDRVLAVYVVDLDGFKEINDRLGHDAGDELLVAVAKRLRAQVRHSDTIARLGGDEFVILARGVAGEPDAWALGRKLIDAFAEPFDLRGQPCRVGLTVGFALSPHDGNDGRALLKRADAAMYAGKQGGKGTVRRGTAAVALVGV